MRKIGVTLAVLLVSAVVAQAGLVTPSTDLTLSLTPDGVATIINNTTHDVYFGGYQIFTKTGTTNLLVASTTAMTATTVSFDKTWRGATQWAPLQKQVRMGSTYLASLVNLAPAGSALTQDAAPDLGDTGGDWANCTSGIAVPGSGSNTANHLAEIFNNVNGVIRAPASGAVVISLGKIVAAGFNRNDFTTQTGGDHTFQWGQVAEGSLGGEWTGQVVTPEPATMSLLVIGGIATLIRRRR